jgi:putative membrane protein
LTTEREPDVRFSLANERTFLAWGRTCMALVATGLAVARLLGDRSENALVETAGIALIVVGALLGFLSYRTYRRNDAAIRAGTPIGRSSLPLVLLVTLGLAAVIAVALSLGG